MKGKPSDLFVGAILRGYDRESVTGKPVTPSAIWDYICIECMQSPNGAFNRMFEWDNSKAKQTNRIGTIREVIEAGYVPGLRIGKDKKGHPVVEAQP